MTRLLFPDHTTGHARTTATQRCRVIGVIVTAFVHHQRTLTNVGQLEPWRQHSMVGIAIGIHIQRRQITQVAVAPRLPVLAAGLGIKM